MLEMNREQTAQWIGHKLSANEDKLFRFLVPVERQRQGDRILVATAYVECDVSFLDTPIPQAALDSVYGVTVDEEGITTSVMTGRVLRDFSLQITPSLNGTKAVVLLGAQEFPVGRRDYVSADDLADWLSYLEAYGFTIDDLLDKQQAQALKQSDAYSTGEE